MQPKTLLWIGAGVLLLILGIFLVWAFSNGLLIPPDNSSQVLKVIFPRLNIRPLDLLDLAARTIAVPLQMFAAALQVSMQQFIDAFRFR